MRAVMLMVLVFIFMVGGCVFRPLDRRLAGDMVLPMEIKTFSFEEFQRNKRRARLRDGLRLAR